MLSEKDLITGLPEELQREIFRYFNRRTLALTSQVCKAWRQLSEHAKHPLAEQEVAPLIQKAQAMDALKALKVLESAFEQAQDNHQKSFIVEEALKHVEAHLAELEKKGIKAVRLPVAAQMAMSMDLAQPTLENKQYFLEQQSEWQAREAQLKGHVKTCSII